MHDGHLAALAVEARWHTAATLLVLPMLMLGLVTPAVLVFGALEMGLATARRRAAGDDPALPVALRAAGSVRRAQPS